MVERETLKNSNTRKIPWPILQPPGFTAFGKIYLRNYIWKDFLSDTPKSSTLAIIAHENTHIERMGSNFFNYLRYWCNSKFRFDEEIAAINSEMKILKDAGEVFDIDRRARDLSSFAYLWCTSYKAAKIRLTEMWN